MKDIAMINPKKKAPDSKPQPIVGAIGDISDTQAAASGFFNGAFAAIPQPPEPRNSNQWLKTRRTLLDQLSGNDEPSTTKPDAANGGDPILTTLIDAINKPADTQLPAQYSGGRVYVQGGSAGHPAALWLCLAVAGGVGVWYFRSKK